MFHSGASALAFFYWRIRGDPREGLRWGELALAAPAAQPPFADRVRLLWASGSLAAYMNRCGVARAWLEESARLARASGDRTMLGSALVFLGYAETDLGESTAASHLQEGISVLRGLGELDNLVLGLNVAVAPYVILGDLDAARAALTECLAHARALGDDWAIAVALSNAGFLDLDERDWSSAAVHLTGVSVPRARETDLDREGVADLGCLRRYARASTITPIHLAEQTRASRREQRPGKLYSVPSLDIDRHFPN